ncbi:pilus assembly protein [Bacillales bacterium AN1005]
MKKRVMVTLLLTIAVTTFITFLVGVTSDRTHSGDSQDSLLPTETTYSVIHTSADGGDETEPSTKDADWEHKAIGGTSVLNAFNIDAGRGHLKLIMKNNSIHPVKVTLTHQGSTDKIYFEKTIAANNTLIWTNFEEGYPQGMRGGAYVLEWSGSEYAVNGEVSGKLASSIHDF